MFYSRLKQICEENNTTVTALSKELHLSSGNLSKWKNGCVPKSETLTKIAEHLNISVDYLLGYTVETDNEEQELIDFFVNLSTEHKRLAIKLVKAVLEASK